jgi:hypothetical protein
LFPTFCAIAGASLPAGFAFDGENMATVFDNHSPSSDKTIFWEYGHNKSNLFHYPAHEFDRSPHLAVREGKWKLLVNPDGSEVQLYDLTGDPNETNNVMNANSKIAEHLKGAALAWKKSLPAYVSENQK